MNLLYMKIVTKRITAQREVVALSEAKKNGFPVAFGDKSLFNTLRINITRESSGTTHSFEIAKEHLPNNKSNTTRFYLKESATGIIVRWCSKVAQNMHKVK